MDKRIFSCKFVFLGLALTLLSAIMTSAAADPVHGSVSFVEVKHDTNSTESASQSGRQIPVRRLNLGINYGI